ncbi:hypothetical protein POVWA2_043530 [Plasmodium ovale wallikeri]|uniref:Uncharacterized protein n=1 Tax=Plasmodium ovale wallikeri TaxID=864142 RepID=A0A1A8ZD85_PLAOA|nr:hypothetical protein POVWA1_044950 [Plasmodium ovale wallikeri]SBT42315.1 hypothetical protein POVWA2_043530 [Plasmodium ovale wallikeri]
MCVYQRGYISVGISAWVYQRGQISVGRSAWADQRGYISVGRSAWVYQRGHVWILQIPPSLPPSRHRKLLLINFLSNRTVSQIIARDICDKKKKKKKKFTCRRRNKHFLFKRETFIIF